MLGQLGRTGRVGSRERPQPVAGMAKKKQRALETKQCQRHLERRLRAEFRQIVEGFMEQAKQGSCAHMRLATELLEEARKADLEKKGTVHRLLEEMGE